MEFIFEGKQLNEISENKFPSKITRYMVLSFLNSTVQVLNDPTFNIKCIMTILHTVKDHVSIVRTAIRPLVSGSIFPNMGRSLLLLQ